MTENDQIDMGIWPIIKDGIGFIDEEFGLFNILSTTSECH